MLWVDPLPDAPRACRKGNRFFFVSEDQDNVAIRNELVKDDSSGLGWPQRCQ